MFCAHLLQKKIWGDSEVHILKMEQGAGREERATVVERNVDLRTVQAAKADKGQYQVFGCQR